MILRKITFNDKTEVCKLIKEGRIIMNKMCSYKINKTSCDSQSICRVFREYMSRKHFFYCIEEKKEVMAFLYGYVRKFPLCKAGYIDFVVVSSKHRGKGYSTQLLNEFYRWLKRKKIDYCALHVLDKNKKAFNIYKKWGFGTAGLVMTKKIG